MAVDTDKGLISFSFSSSSSSSSRPTPPPYLVVPKPLPEELRNQIIAESESKKYHYSFYAHLIEPEVCIDPDDSSSWEHNEDDVDVNEVSSFLLKNTKFFFPNQIPLVPGKKIDGSPIFELYYIKIIKLDPPQDFSSIFMKGTNTNYRPMMIYKLPKGKKIPFNQPLPLQNIFRPPSALDYVMISLTNPASGGWSFWLGPPHYNPEDIKYGPYIRKVMDELTASKALISYELIKSAAVAELEFTLLNDKELPIKIVSGSIYATTNGVPSTERIIRQFSSSEPSVLLPNNKPVPVNRSVFGVSLGSRLHLHVNLHFVVGRAAPIHTIVTTIEIPVPNETKSVEEYIPLIEESYSIAKMRVKVSWWDFMV